MPYDFAEKLFNKTRIGMRVIISPNDAAPVEFSHPVLFVPNAKTVAAAPARAETLVRHGWRSPPFRRTRKGTRGSFAKVDCRSPLARTSERFGSSSSTSIAVV